jgi:hypothetical protein
MKSTKLELEQTKKRLSKLNLRRDIVIVLIVKVVLLWLLWYACFSDPIAKDQRLELITKSIMNR